MKEKRYIVPPVKLAFVHLTKPYDLAHVAQVALATDHCELIFVGNSLSLENPKVMNKITSWDIPRSEIEKIKTQKVSSLDDLKKNSNCRLVGTSPYVTKNAFQFSWKPEDLIVIGPPSGLSKKDKNLMDELVKIPLLNDIPFLTVPTVVTSLTYHILDTRGLWKKIE